VTINQTGYIVQTLVRVDQYTHEILSYVLLTDQYYRKAEIPFNRIRNENRWLRLIVTRTNINIIYSHTNMYIHVLRVCTAHIYIRVTSTGVSTTRCIVHSFNSQDLCEIIMLFSSWKPCRQ